MSNDISRRTAIAGAAATAATSPLPSQAARMASAEAAAPLVVVGSVFSDGGAAMFQVLAKQHDEEGSVDHDPYPAYNQQD